MTVVPFTPRPQVPEHRRNTGSPLEQARGAVINRVAAALHMANTEDMPGYPTWEQWVDWAYESADTNPEMLEDVSNTIIAARAAIEAMQPTEPDWDEAIFHEIGGDPAEMSSTVEDWIKAVLT